MLSFVGPLNLDVQDFNGSLPSLLLNPYSWTKVVLLIFLLAELFFLNSCIHLFI